MKQAIIGLILVVIVIIIQLYQKEIVYLFYEYQFNKSYQEVKENDYYEDYQFIYVKDHQKRKLEKKEDIINSIFYLLNSGSNTIERYCGINYTDCTNDIKEIANDQDLLSDLNNFVHPYNNFKTITFEYDKYISLKIETTKIYTKDLITEIDNKVNQIIKDNIKDNMTNEEKIRTIHDYIINNTKYDTLRAANKDDNTYQSNTAYGVLFQGYGICSGYVDAMSIFLNKFKIPNYKVSNQTHIWNLIYINNKWLHLDLTWDDPVTSNNKDLLLDTYYLITTKEIQSLDEKHQFDKTKFKEAQ